MHNAKSPDSTQSRTHTRVVNISLDKIRSELDSGFDFNSNQVSSSKNCKIALFYFRILGADESINHLTPYQQQEILRIRKEGSDKCSFIMNQVN